MAIFDMDLRGIEGRANAAFDASLPLPVLDTLRAVPYLCEAVRTLLAEKEKAERERALTEADFAQLATTSPDRLLNLISAGNLRGSQLTFAAEAAGSVGDKQRALNVLRDLLMHSSALVREGIVYGLAAIASNDARALLESMASSDPSPSVRRAAAESLEDIC